MKIPKEYKGRGDQKGWQFTLIDRRDDIALYEKKNASGVSRYDLMLVSRYKADVYIKERLVAKEGAECLPSSGQWGSRGWTFFKKSDAVAKMNKLKKNKK